MRRSLAFVLLLACCLAPAVAAAQADLRTEGDVAKARVPTRPGAREQPGRGRPRWRPGARARQRAGQALRRPQRHGPAGRGPGPAQRCQLRRKLRLSPGPGHFADRRRRPSAPSWSRVSARTTSTAWLPHWACRCGAAAATQACLVAGDRRWQRPTPGGRAATPMPRAACSIGRSNVASGWACPVAMPPNRRWSARSGARTPPRWPALPRATARRCNWWASSTAPPPAAWTCRLGLCRRRQGAGQLEHHRPRRPPRYGLVAPTAPRRRPGQALRQEGRQRACRAPIAR